MTVGRALEKAIFVVGAKRTAFGAFGGSLKSQTPVDLQTIAGKAALESGKVNPESVDSVVVGNVLSCASSDAPYIARHVGLRLGIRERVPALTVNRLCGSGFQSIVNGVQEMMMGDASVVLTGGSDNMSACPFALRDVRFGHKLGSDMKMEDMMWASLTDAHIKSPMGITAENLAVKYNITRAEVDAYALRSQTTWAAAHEAGIFKHEITPIEMKSRKGTIVFQVDENPKPKTTIESITKLPPVFKKDGVTCAASASGICDGAGAVVLASEEAVKAHGYEPLARIVGYGITGCDPNIMGIGPVPSIRALCDKTGISLEQVDYIEINEAFAAQVLACQKELGIPDEKFNTCGGGISIGHPLAASGSRISAHLVHKLKHNNKRYGIGSACIGGGQGIAILFESL
uniref:3-ketoacyl-CoA thiolase, mitochondrial n=1 Tax=Lepeophtheirus salmonis TaxID=72036 RepID=C1BSQ3_LEPSM|nr:3-ketoacyl-CoA thiolase, mitochondrial [Lepeophtheirus salmonis]